jgi:hypothetical protein
MLSLKSTQTKLILNRNKIQQFLNNLFAVSVQILHLIQLFVKSVKLRSLVLIVIKPGKTKIKISMSAHYVVAKVKNLKN